MIAHLVLPIVPGDYIGLQIMPEVEGRVDFVVGTIMEVRVPITHGRLRGLEPGGCRHELTSLRLLALALLSV